MHPPASKPRRISAFWKSLCALAIVVIITLFVVIWLDLQATKIGSPPAHYPQTFPTDAPALPPEPTRSATTLPDPNSTEGVELLLERFDHGHLAFNAPKAIPLRQSQVIQLAISPTGTPEELAALIVAPGDVETSAVRVSGIMQADLSGGSAFRVEPLSPAEQLVGRAEATEWRWRVTAIEGGKHALHLAVTAIIRTGEREVRRKALRAFDHDIMVEVSTLGRMGDLFSATWALWAGGGLVIFLGWYGWRRRTFARRRHPAAMVAAGAPIFVSYARRDLARIRPLVEALEARGYPVWIDLAGIEGATLWTAEIAHAIRGCRVVLFMATPAAMESEYVTRELLLAQEERKAVVPVWFSSAELPAALRLPLAGLQRVEAGEQAPAATAEKIARALERLEIVPQG